MQLPIHYNYQSIFNMNDYLGELVLYYVPYCCYSTEMLKELLKLKMYTDVHFPKLKITRVNCMSNANIIYEKNIQSYPTIRLCLQGQDEITFIKNEVDVLNSLISFVSANILINEKPLIGNSDNINIHNIDIHNIDIDNIDINNIEIDNIDINNIDINNIEIDNIDISI